MKRLNDVLTANCLAFALLYTAAATAQQIQTPNTFFDNFEALEVGPLEGQPGEGFPRDGFSQRDPTMVTEEQANSGTKSIVFASGGANGFGRAIHVGFLDNDPALGPVIWEERFSVYVPSTGDDAFLESTAFSNFPDLGPFGPEVAIRQNDAGSFRVEVGGTDIGAGNFATDQWWDVVWVGDGAAKVITDVSIGEFNASGLSVPWNRGDFLIRPERVYYSGAGLFVDDVGSRIIPEPATVWLLLLGGVGVLRMRRR